MERLVIGGGLLAMAVGSLGKALTYMGDDLECGEEVESVRYSEFEARAKTGDLILTSYPSITRAFTKSMWSHCGMVWRETEPDGRIYEWSSHMESEGVLNTVGEPRGGTQLVPMDYLASDNGAVFWRHVALGPERRRRVREFVDLLKYQVDFSSLPELAVFLGPIGASLFSDFGTGMTCSHIVAATYLAAEALTLDRSISRFSPETFSPTGDASWLVPVAERVSMVVGFDMKSLISIS